MVITDSKTVCSRLYTRWIALFGSPESIRTNAGTELKNRLMENTLKLKKIGVNIKISAPYNHQSNPVERFHRTLWNLVRAKMANGEQDWEN